ncbi:MAG: hypothetical protein ED859_14145 [Desulfuromonadales bacterium]|nr:MAG: hypothetical protein ED859_14145 [Desulfuromonadales bacterium]
MLTIVLGGVALMITCALQSEPGQFPFSGFNGVFLAAFLAYAAILAEAHLGAVLTSLIRHKGSGEA